MPWKRLLKYEQKKEREKEEENRETDKAVALD